MKSSVEKISQALWLAVFGYFIAHLAGCQKEKLKAATTPSMKISAAKSMVYVGEESPISLQLDHIGHRFHIVEKDDRKVEIRGQNGRLATDWYTDRDQGDTLYLYLKPMEEGLHKIVFRTTGDSGQSAADTLALNAVSTAFTVKSNIRDSTAYVGQKVAIQFQIKGEGYPEPPRSFTFKSSLKVKLTYNGKPYTQGDTVNIGTKTDIKVILQPQKPGKAGLEFTFSNKYKKNQESSIPLMVKLHKFKLRVSNQQEKKIYINKAVSIPLQITDQEDIHFAKNLSCYSNPGGSFTVDGKPCTADKPIDIGTKTDISVSFQPEEIGETGEAVLNFKISDAYGQVKDSTSVKVIDVPFSVEVKAMPDQGNKLAEQATIKITVKPLGNVDARGITYHLTTTGLKGTGTGKFYDLRDLPTDLLIEIEPNKTFTFYYKLDRVTELEPTKERESKAEPKNKHTISLTVEDKYGGNYQKKITREDSLEVVNFPKVTNANLYYKHKSGSIYRYIKANSIHGERGDYDISKVSIHVYNCVKGFKIDTTLDYHADDQLNLYTSKHDGLQGYRDSCGCEPGKARGNIQLIDAQGNKSRSFVVTMHK